MKISNVFIWNEEGHFEKGNLQIQGERISSIRKENSLGDGPGYTGEGEKLYAIPGLIDIHMHGSLNRDFCSAKAEDIQTIAEFEGKEGVTSFLLATMAQPKDILLHCCEAAGNYESKSGAEFLGINLEAPFISKEKRGAQNGDYILKPDVELFHKFQKVAAGRIRIVGIAPEVEGAKEFIAQLKDEVVISIAHSDADYQTAKGAFDLGVTHITHLFNAMSNFHHRNPGIVGAVIEDEASMVEMICDGNFVHPVMMKTMMKAIGPERLVFISDSMPATGLLDGEYMLGGDSLIIRDGVGSMKRDGALAGPTLSLMGCMKSFIRKTGIPLEKALKCATINPARSIGIEKDYGSIVVGKYADIVVLDQHLNIKAVMKKGKYLVNNLS